MASEMTLLLLLFSPFDLWSGSGTISPWNMVLRTSSRYPVCIIFLSKNYIIFFTIFIRISISHICEEFWYFAELLVSSWITMAFHHNQLSCCTPIGWQPILKMHCYWKIIIKHLIFQKKKIARWFLHDFYFETWTGLNLFSKIRFSVPFTTFSNLEN